MATNHPITIGPSGQFTPSGKPLVYVIFDTETTGKSATTSRIVEIAATRYEDGKAVSHFSELVNPGVFIPAEAEAIHGINTLDVFGAPRTPEVLSRFQEFIRGADALVGHGIASYDIPLVRNEMQRYGMEGRRPPLVIDTLQEARWKWPTLGAETHFSEKPYSLSKLATHFSLEQEGAAHRAAADVATTEKLLPLIMGDTPNAQRAFVDARRASLQKPRGYAPPGVKGGDPNPTRLISRKRMGRAKTLQEFQALRHDTARADGEFFNPPLEGDEGHLEARFRDLPLPETTPPEHFPGEATTTNLAQEGVSVGERRTGGVVGARGRGAQLIEEAGSWAKKNWKSLAIGTGVATVGAAALAYSVYGGGNSFSGKDDAYNTITGMQEGGRAADSRHAFTEFGSGWKGLYPLLDDVAGAAIRIGRRMDSFEDKGSNTIPGRDDAYNTIDGMSEAGWAAKLRHQNTHFGSGAIMDLVNKTIGVGRRAFQEVISSTRGGYSRLSSFLGRITSPQRKTFAERLGPLGSDAIREEVASIMRSGTSINLGGTGDLAKTNLRMKVRGYNTPSQRGTVQGVSIHLERDIEIAGREKFALETKWTLRKGRNNQVGGELTGKEIEAARENALFHEIRESHHQTRVLEKSGVLDSSSRVFLGEAKSPTYRAGIQEEIASILNKSAVATHASIAVPADELLYAARRGSDHWKMAKAIRESEMETISQKMMSYSPAKRQEMGEYSKRMRKVIGSIEEKWIPKLEQARQMKSAKISFWGAALDGGRRHMQSAGKFVRQISRHGGGLT